MACPRGIIHKLVIFFLLRLVYARLGSQSSSSDIDERGVAKRPPISWGTNNSSNLRNYVDADMRNILLPGPVEIESDTRFGLGFLRMEDQAFLLTVYSFMIDYRLQPLPTQSQPLGNRIVLRNNMNAGIASSPADPPNIVWSANSHHHVRENSSLELKRNGDLVLKDHLDGSIVWSTNTSNLNVTSMELKLNGNLVLVNDRGMVVWQSFDHPANVWLPEQKLYSGMSLTNGIFILSVEDTGIYAFVDASPPQMYGILFLYPHGNETKQFPFGYLQRFPTYVTYVNTETNLFFLRLESNGKLNYGNEHNKGNSLIFNDNENGPCAYPTVCGNYGICSEGSCYCPSDVKGNMTYIRRVNATEASQGCALVTPLSCQDTQQLHTFLDLENITYFDFVPSLFDTDVEACKQACLRNCSCKAAVFRYQNNNSSGNCSLPLQLFSLRRVPSQSSTYNAVTFIKVQRSSPAAKSKTKDPSMAKILAPSLTASVVLIIFVIWVCYYGVVKKKQTARDEWDMTVYPVVRASISRFSFVDLRSATKDFQSMLGQGGFGSVFEGNLRDGTRVAVKRLNSVEQGRQEFLAELDIIGNILHFNLVKLIGYCMEGSNRLLVYEHMPNGSLDKWIFNSDISTTLNWETRRKIIHGISMGLEYLHEHCNRSVIHFDIKPQNILLDKDFNVKISDFGLAKLVDREISQVVTRLKGTPGYMAPELFRGGISVKADVYSFGVVILEIVSGQKSLSTSQIDTLVSIVQRKAELDQLSDLVDEHNDDMQCHKEEATKMVMIAIWCLQSKDKRPFMSMVVKVLEGLRRMEPITDYSFLSTVHMDSSSPLTASLLSAPR